MIASASIPSKPMPIGSGISDRLSKKASRHVKERIIEGLLFSAAAFSVFVTIAIVYVLVKESWVFFQTVPLSDFLFDTQWTPLFDDCLLYTSPSPRDRTRSRMPSSA